MLWLEWEGGQLPIGWDAGPAATIPNLFGTSWKIYEGVNTGNGMTVVSSILLCNEHFFWVCGGRRGNADL